MFSKLVTVSKSRWYWSLLILMGLSFETVALFYQYGLDYGPCVLCIHVRILVMAFMMVGVLALLWHKPAISSFAHLLNIGVMGWMSERAWVLIGTERGTIFASCGMSSGLPSWFALDTWFPTVFGIWESCGYTPELLFGITMAEALIVFAPLMLVVSIILFIASFFENRANNVSEFSLFH